MLKIKSFALNINFLTHTRVKKIISFIIFRVDSYIGDLFVYAHKYLKVWGIVRFVYQYQNNNFKYQNSQILVWNFHAIYKTKNIYFYFHIISRWSYCTDGTNLFCNIHIVESLLSWGLNQLKLVSFKFQNTRSQDCFKIEYSRIFCW